MLFAWADGDGGEILMALVGDGGDVAACPSGVMPEGSAMLPDLASHAS